MKLNYALNGQGAVVVLLHGLFGNLDNLGVLARELVNDHQVLQIDLRNHGLSPWSDAMDYNVMAEDLANLLVQLNLNDVTVIGHSMGGKVAMALTMQADQRLKQLIILDVAPVAYPGNHHQQEFSALQAVSQSAVQQRRQAAEIMRQHLKDEATIQFLLKSFYQGQWRFNLDALHKQYDMITDWQEVTTWQKPVMFIAGGLSSYIQTKDHAAIARQFPYARAHIVAGAGHWVHGDKPAQVLRIIRQRL